MQLRHAVATDNGRARDHNEDAFQIETKPARAGAGALFVVCDGMGGFASGEVASELAAETIVAHYYATPAPDPGTGLRGAFDEANRRVWREGRGKMGTTGVAALFIGDAALLANVGDSRAYLLRAGAIRQLTSDHSFVAEQVVAGMLTADEARTSSYRNIITRALGYRPEVDVDLYQEAVFPGDRVLLCSDGLYGSVEPHELAELATSGPLEPAVDELIALANDRGGQDNITAVLVEVVDVQPGSAGPPPPPAPATRPNVQSAGQAPKGGTARLPATQAPVRDRADGRSRQSVRSQRSVTPPLAPSAAPARVRRAPILGLILMTLLGLALLGAMVWFVLTSEPTSLPLTAPPPLPTSTAVPGQTSAPATATRPTPTLVPTPAATTRATSGTPPARAP